MTTNEIRTKFLEFYKERNHVIIPRANLVPQEDPTTLFTGSGMQPLLPYLLGQKHPQGQRLTDSQPSFRAEDIEEVGDNRHTTFFEMLGNWSLGDYFKKEQLEWFLAFLTDELQLDANKLYVTVFAGDVENNIPRDDETATIWQELFKSKGIEAKVVELLNNKNGAEQGMQGGRIFYYDSAKNWWSRTGAPANMPAGEPGGPDSEVFYEFAQIEHNPAYGKHCHPNCDCGRFLEIGNSVFMQYLSKRKVILADAIHCLIDEDRVVNKELADFIVKNEVIVVTNAKPSEVKEQIKDYPFQVFSMENNPGKTSSEYFENLLKKFNLNADDVLYFDHKKENVQAAATLGITSSIYKDNEQAKQFLIDNNYLSFTELPQKNVDFGGGLERLVAATLDDSDVFMVDSLWPIIQKLEEASGKKYDDAQEAMRVIADHIRSAVFMAVDGVTPSNSQQGYVLRRLIRRAVRQGLQIDLEQELMKLVTPVVVEAYKESYPEVVEHAEDVEQLLSKEESVFRQTIRRGLNIFEKRVLNEAAKGWISQNGEIYEKPPAATIPLEEGQNPPIWEQYEGEFLTGVKVFELYDTFGFPSELSIEEANRNGIPVSQDWKDSFKKEMKAQKERSRTAAKGQFKGGLGGEGDMHKKYHTATHLMYRALREVLGDHVVQRGSNITDERLRFDFNHPEKMTDEEIKKVEAIVNERIAMDLDVSWEEIPTEDALAKGAYGAFGDKYGDTVKVYSMQDKDGKKYSFEICGGPHVDKTGELAKDGSSAGSRSSLSKEAQSSESKTGSKDKKFKITKEQSSSAGVRRIKAVLQ